MAGKRPLEPGLSPGSTTTPSQLACHLRKHGGNVLIGPVDRW